MMTSKIVNPHILIAVPFKDNSNLVINFISSLQHSYVSGFTYSILLWDDGSDINEVELLYQKYKNMKIIIVRNEHKGYTHSVYNIISFAKVQNMFDYILLANSDVLFKRNTMFAMVKRIVSNVNIAVVGGKVLKWRDIINNNIDNLEILTKIMSNDDEIIHTGTRLESEQIVDPYIGMKSGYQETNFQERRLWVNGCASLYNLDILRRENLNFSLEFTPAYFEEADLQTTLNLLGYSIIYEPRAELYHMVGATHHKDKEKYEEIFWRNWEKYKEKWSNKFSNKALQF